MATKPNIDRRGFLGGVLTGVAASGLLGLRKARAAQPPEEPRRKKLYRRTQHVEQYYRTLKD